jgi:hypothetical protein
MGAFELAELLDPNGLGIPAHHRAICKRPRVSATHRNNTEAPLVAGTRSLPL